MHKRSEKIRKLILLAAAYEFADHGYNGASYNSIAKRAGIAKGLVQYHIPTKADLATAVITEAFTEGVFLAPTPHGPPARGVEAILRFTMHVAKMYLRSPYARASVRLITERTDADADIPKPYVGWINKIREYLVEAQQDGEIRRNVNPAEEAWVLVATFTGIKTVSETLVELKEFPFRAGRTIARLLLTLGARRAELILAALLLADRVAQNGT